MKIVITVVSGLIIFSTIVAHGHAQIPSVAASSGDMIYRAPFDLKLQIDKGHYYQQHFDRVPYVADNVVYLFVKENFGINVTITDDQISGISYQSDAAKADVTFKFTQEKAGGGQTTMMLITQNKLKRALHFDALMTIPGKQGAFKTSIVPIMPSLSNFESWPRPIVQLALQNFRFVDTGSTASQAAPAKQ